MSCHLHSIPPSFTAMGYLLRYEQMTRAINHPREPSQNFAALNEDSQSDSLLLEMRLALELQTRDLVEKIYPVFIGDKLLEFDAESVKATESALSPDDTYGHYFKDGCHPKFDNDDVVKSVERLLRTHLERLCLGCPLLEEMPTAVVVKAVVKNQGHVVDGSLGPAFDVVQQDIYKMLMHKPDPPSVEGAGTSPPKLKKRNSLTISSSTMKESAVSAASPLISGSSKIVNPKREKFLAAVMAGIDSPDSESGSVKGPKNLSPIRQSRVPEELRVTDMMTFLRDCGLLRSKSRQYAQKLVVNCGVDTPKSLLKMYDNARLMNILNGVMDRQDAETVSKEIFRARKSGDSNALYYLVLPSYDNAMQCRAGRSLSYPRKVSEWREQRFSSASTQGVPLTDRVCAIAAPFSRWHGSDWLQSEAIL